MTEIEAVDVLRKEIRDNGAEQAFTEPELVAFLSAGIRDYSKYRPRIREGSIELVAGQARYQLPVDFLRFYEEPEDMELRVIDGQVRFTPAPALTGTWNFDYYAVHTWDSLADSNPVVLFAVDKAYRGLAGDETKLAKYRIGRDGVEVDISRVPDQLLKLAQEARRQYEDQVRFTAFGAVG